MLILGLTGSLATGKSTVTAMFADRGVATFDADRAVHELYAGSAVALVEAAFPGTTANGAVDREKLAEQVVGNRAALSRLEAIVHPLVRDAEVAFRAEAAAAGNRIVLLDIPLLFEVNRDRDVDAVVVVTAAEAMRKARFLARPGMTEDRYAALVARQTSDAEKRARAHFLIDTSGDFAATRRQVAGVLSAVAGMAGGR